MTLILSGTDGLSDVDGSAATPAIRGTDANTGIFFPAADTIAFSEGGAEVARFNADAQFVAAAGTASLPVITTTGDVNTGIFFPAADTIAFAEGGVESMRINSSGNVGIGTSSPGAGSGLATKLDVVTPNGTATRIGLAQSGVNSAGITIPASVGGLGFEVGATERMRIDSSGNVGIGTASPATKLHVSGNMTLADYGNIGATNNNAGISLTGGSAANNGGQINLRGGSFGTANAIEFIQGGTEQARIDTGGVFKFNSGYGSVATAYGCRAWVNFNGTGTVAIRGSGNVSSITDNGAGNYTVNYTTAMPDANYVYHIGSKQESAGLGDSGYVTNGSAGGATDGAAGMTTTRIRLQFTNFDSPPAARDQEVVCVSIFR